MRKVDVLELKDCPESVGDQVINSLIVAGFNFFGTLAGIGATQCVSDPRVSVLAAAISAGVGFFGALMAQRGLKKHEEE